MAVLGRAGEFEGLSSLGTPYTDTCTQRQGKQAWIMLCTDWCGMLGHPVASCRTGESSVHHFEPESKGRWENGATRCPHGTLHSGVRGCEETHCYSSFGRETCYIHDLHWNAKKLECFPSSNSPCKIIGRCVSPTLQHQASQSARHWRHNKNCMEDVAAFVVQSVPRPPDFHPFWSCWTAAYQNITMWLTTRRDRMPWASGCSFCVLSHTCLCSSYLIRLDCMEVIILALEHKPWSAVLCKFLEHSVTFYLIARCLCWNAFLIVQFSKTVSVCFHNNFRDRVKD